MKLGLLAINRRERGATLLLFTLMLLLIVVPLVGLAIDGGVIFWTKAKLSAAVDAAALAAGRSINLNQTSAANKLPVQNVAYEWFTANFPTGWMGTTIQGGKPVVTPTQTSYSTQQVNVTATVTVPVFFMRVAGFSSVTLSAAAQSSRRNTFVVLVLDRSGSMGSSAIGSNACPTMQADSINFVNMFTEGFDTLSLITYSSSAGPNPDFGPSQTFKSGMAAEINQIVCTGATSMAQALQMAYQLIKSKGLSSGLNAIVLFTDGQPNEIVGAFTPFSPSSTATRYGSSPPWWAVYGNPYTQNYNTLYSYGPTGCTHAFPTAAQGGAGLTLLFDTSNFVPPAQFGMTGGLLDTTDQVAVSTSAGTISNSGCSYINNGSEFVRQDVAYIPSQDIWGNLTSGGYGGNPPYYGANVTAPDKYPAGDPYAGQIRVDEQTNGVMAASTNAADYQAQVIRNDTNYPTVIFTIGLGGAKDMPIDFTLLERIANDQRSPILDSSKPQGYFAYASSPSQLNQAFTLVAGQILRLSQ